MDRLADIADARALLRQARETLVESNRRMLGLRADAQWATTAAEPIRERLDACAHLSAVAIDDIDTWDRDLAQAAERALIEAAG
ncbi:MAG: hypothetical protein BGN98_07475 [Microbacterium sp. 69-7]|uniref:Uncharacterized protein n=1 Tax=Microbacterium laevaniformans TaxID=36807 RepID=A0A150HI19_9MICO|nr:MULTISPECIES: hypothetical protein [Microbacterium]EPD84457.1 hypothetical protein HMPREF1529_01059 [Microbacterium sp. oral taxon 186 str. F0373]KXZ61685.1 hypothetical protein Mlaev_00307 [Microbacterium laevaniformans]ODT23633.1 MAG: hypothetical protein ABS64_08840 [Microbacterium sp. SCN 69-37]OJU47458.1 MAG: hypothetical protein BGN98_07475 [Microbacterium sp. 69-7]